MRCHVELPLTLIAVLHLSAVTEMQIIYNAPQLTVPVAKHRRIPSQNDVDKLYPTDRHRPTSGPRPLPPPTSIPDEDPSTMAVEPGAVLVESRVSLGTSSASGCVCLPNLRVVRCRGLGAAAALRNVITDFQSSSAVTLDELHLTDVDAVVDVLRRPRTPRQPDVLLEGLRVRRLVLACSGGGSSRNADRSDDDSGLDSWTLAAGVVSTTELTELTITGCRLRQEPSAASGSPSLTAGLSRLRALRIRFAGLESLPFTAASALSPSSTEYWYDLRELQLWGNRLTSLGDLQFYGFSGLTLLDLDRNQLSSIRRRTWSGLDSLASLRLSHNRLSTLPDRAFADLPRLRSLAIDHNVLGFLHPNALFGLVNLLVLRLADNRIPFVADGAFSELPSLRRLDLSGNHLDRIWSGTFVGLRSLEWIDLSRNRLGRVPDGSFRQSAALDWIRLDWNRLSVALSRCTLSPTHHRRRLKAVSSLGNQIQCGNGDDCRTAWLSRTAMEELDVHRDWATSDWTASTFDWSVKNVWGNCLTNGTDGSLIVTSLTADRRTSHKQEWCSTRDCDN